MLLSVSSIFSQEVELTKDTAEVKLILSYREDQFYFGLPIIHNRSRQEYHKISFQQVFSGFLRDMPINKDRTHAVAVD
jgi:hypothetical protein